MGRLPYSIELHDSHLAKIEHGTDALTLCFRPAYVHRDGKGWLQDADLIIGRASVEPSQPELPVQIADGTLKTSDGPHHNLLYLPLRCTGHVYLELELFSESFIRVEGEDAEVKLCGDPRYLEDLT